MGDWLLYGFPRYVACAVRVPCSRSVCLQHVSVIQRMEQSHCSPSDFQTSSSDSHSLSRQLDESWPRFWILQRGSDRGNSGHCKTLSETYSTNLMSSFRLPNLNALLPSFNKDVSEIYRSAHQCRASPKYLLILNHTYTSASPLLVNLNHRQNQSVLISHTDSSRLLIL